MNKAVIIMLLFIPVISINSQDFEEEFNKSKAQAENEYGQFKNNIITAYVDYLNTIDAEFSDYLKENWKEYQLHSGLNPPDKPKPTEIPAYSEKIQEPPTQIQFSHEQKTIEIPELIMPVPRELKTEESLQLSLDFYGNQFTIEYDNNFKKIILREVNELNISECWDKLNLANYGHLVIQLNDIKYRLNLNDWGYYTLVKKVTEAIAGAERNTSLLLTWFFMNKSRYKIKLGYANDRTYLLIPSNNTIYETSYFNLNGINYFIPGFKGDQINTYDKDYVEAERLISLYIEKPLNFKTEELNRAVNFSYLGKSFQFNLKYNKNLIDFYREYPLTDLPVYFNSPLSALTLNTFHQNFDPVLKNRTINETVNFLLHFVQIAFEYKIDQEHLNKEKFYFPEEILFYPYSDCEDRSVFFAGLIKELLNMDIIGVDFPGHVATGINFNDNTEGDYIAYNHNKYIICDPTYLNAPIGKLIEEFKEQEGKVIGIDNKQNQRLQKDIIWDAISKIGGKRGNNSRDVVFDDDGNYYVTGYFKGIMNIGVTLLESLNESNDVFIAKIDKSNTIIWAKSLGGTGEDLSYCLTIDENRNVYIFGRFENRLMIDELDISPVNGLNGFIAKLDSNGLPIYLQNLEIDTSGTDNYFLTKFSSDNKQEWINYIQNYQSPYNFDIQVDETGQLFVAGFIPYLKNPFMLSVASVFYSKISEFDIINMLIEENAMLVKKEYEKTIAALFAAINLISRENIILTGEIIQKTFDKGNPDFKSSNKTIYDNIGYIRAIQKQPEGKIQIQTADERKVLLNNFEISNKAEFSITNLNDGNARIDIYEGIKIGGQSISWSILNYTKLLKQDGSLFFDYGNNYKTSMRMKPDIIN